MNKRDRKQGTGSLSTDNPILISKLISKLIITEHSKEKMGGWSSIYYSISIILFIQPIQPMVGSDVSYPTDFFWHSNTVSPHPSIPHFSSTGQNPIDHETR